MKIWVALTFVLCFAHTAAAQTAQPGATPQVRPRVAGGSSSSSAAVQPTATPRPTVTVTPTPAVPRPTPSATPAPGQTPRPIVVGAPNNATPTPTPTPGAPYIVVTPVTRPTATPAAGAPSPTPIIITIPVPRAALLNLTQIRARQAEARRSLTTRPVATAFGSTAPLTSIVTVSALDPKTNTVHTISLPKETFLTENYESPWITSLGKVVRIRTIRSNYVNTAVVISDNAGQAWAPLIVQYPIEKYGKFQEMAYYTSAHPALLSTEVSRAGQLYVRTTLEVALKRLRERGKYISPPVIAVAEQLCLVEHVDHQRFKNELQAPLFDEVFSLFALNEGSTYRYSVSSAGAGGMVQMIPATYRMVRSMHFNVPLTPDFVTGMRDHNNAMQAMLLYMQDTWSDQLANPTINNALETGIAAEHELLAAGYNSNPAKLAGYIRRGGENWRNLIPRETQMYLQIQRSVLQNVKPLPPVK